MGIGDLLLGVAGNLIYDLIKIVAKDFTGYDKDDLQEKINNVYDIAVKQFYHEHGNKYGTSDSSFLVREQNREVIVKSLFFSSEPLTIQEINPNGFDDVEAVDDEGFTKFISILETQFHQDFFLDKILVEKAKLASDKLFQEKVEKILCQIEKQSLSMINGKVFVGKPPSLSSKHHRRTRLLREVMDSAFIGPTEVIGASGSGKTLLASELIEHVKVKNYHVETFYIQVKDNSDFLDIMSSIITSITKFCNSELSGITEKRNFSYEECIKHTAEIINSSVRPIYILFDLSEGTCNDIFAKNLSDFLEAFHAKCVYIVVFGQESIFRELSGLRREYLKIPGPIYMPGFDFDEFVQLVKHYQGNYCDRTFLWSIFEKLTAGRNSGLLARVADIFASTSIEDMKRLVSIQPNQIMEKADREKYKIIAGRFRTAAEKIVCLLLPFSIEEASTVFCTDYIAETVHEMLRYGLLRYHDEKRLEMHETTRAGLEEMVPPAVRKTIHEELGRHYLTKGDIITGILHMERAGKGEEANRIAREYFLRGEYWEALYIYVLNHDIVEGFELVKFLQLEPLPDKAYILPRVFKGIGNHETAQELMRLIIEQSERFVKDFQWAWLITEAVIACDITKIHELINFGIQKTKQNQPEVLEYIISGVRRHSIIVDETLREVFMSQGDKIKMQLVPLLLRDKRREVLSKVLQFLSIYMPSGDEREKQEICTLYNELKLNNKQEIIEFIAAIPLIKQVKDIILFKTVFLDNVSGFIWENRRVLRAECKALLEVNPEGEDIIENSLRILSFLNDPDVVKMAEKYIGMQGRIGTFAISILSLFPNLISVDLYLRTLLDISVNKVKRQIAFTVLLWSGTCADCWFNRLSSIDRENTEMWECYLLLNSIHHPNKSVIPILKKMIDKERDSKFNRIYSPLIVKIGELPGEDINDFLISLLDCSISEIRATACLCLQFKRSRRSLPALVALCRVEQDEKVAQVAILAAIASYPPNFNEFDEIWPRFPLTTIWRLVLAGRLKVATEADYIIRIANDPQGHWQIRRAAILAASQFRIKPLMRVIAECIFSEKSSFTQDINCSLLGHNILSVLALEFAQSLKSRYRSEKGKCHALLADLFDSMKNESIFSYGVPSGEEAAKWFFERLEASGWPEDLCGADTVMNEINIPTLQAAVLKGLSLCGDLEMIEEIISTADTEWLLMRALCEWLKGRSVSQYEMERIGRIAESRPFGNSVSVKNVLNNSKGRTNVAINKSIVTSEEKKLEYRQVTYEDIKQALQDGALKTDLPLIITGINRTQFLELVQELSPENDFKQCWVPAEPKINFTGSGFSVNGGKPLSIERYTKIRAALRPALIAANCFHEKISWHQSLLEENNYGQNAYVKGLLTALTVQKNRERLFEELNSYGDIYLSQLDDYRTYELMANLFDERMIPFLQHWIYTENHKVFEVLCRIMLHIKESSIDNILAKLLYRWCDLLKLSCQKRCTDNIHLWRAFDCLKKHTRFMLIPGYDLRLSELLALNVRRYHKNEIIEVLCNSSRMYSVIETQLIKTTNFEHFYHDEVDKLDEAAQNIFMIENTEYNN